MIDQTFLHCPGIGPKTESRLKAMGYGCWDDCLSRPEDLPFGRDRRRRFLDLLAESRSALEERNIDFFVSRYPIREHWRILGTFYHQATFFDIETTGLSRYDSHTTVIAAYCGKKLHTFVDGENLDGFLNLVDDSDLLVAFNGSSFDIPFLEHSFNIPKIECPHVDLRWISYYRGYTGGLKAIEKRMGLTRPHEIGDIDGYEAVVLYYQWQNGDLSARERLINYCQADVLASYLVAGRLLSEIGIPVSEADPNQLFETFI
ncbi:MAG: ribonuclease H-like domain-containing protein [Proteobacteria bacterium]|nr:ribonuclease H-like domain-containing protein [Pseudomonadota bacterium]